MTDRVAHVLVMFNQSKPARRALLDAAAIADEHDAQLTVVALVDHDERKVGCVGCGVARTYWNAAIDEMAGDDLLVARRVLGERHPAPEFVIAGGRRRSDVRRVAAQLGCDVVVVPRRRLLPRHATRRWRHASSGDIVELRV